MLDQAAIAALREEPTRISTVERAFTVELTGEDGTVHASIDKTVHVRCAELASNEVAQDGNRR